MNDLVFSSASELAEAIRSGELSSVEVLEAYLEQIERHNSTLNAIVTLDADGAMAHARAADKATAIGELWGPLHGVPITIKDAIETAGFRTTVGFPPLADHVPDRDATAVARLRAAGAILLGKTNVPELSADTQTNNPIFGRTNNPWDLERTPGGSTGGGAAAVAAGLTPVELGADHAGSLRIPASFCGICALKPTEHRVPTTGHLPPLPGAPRAVRHMNTIGPLARTIDDLQLILRIIAGPDEQDWEVPPVPLVAAPEVLPERLRLAWTADFGGKLVVARETREAMQQLAEQLEALGCRIYEQTPDDFDVLVGQQAMHQLLVAERNWTRLPEEERDSVETPNMQFYSSTLDRRDALSAALTAFLGRWDAFLCPTTAGPAFYHCPAGADLSVDDQTVPHWMATVAFNSSFSVTGVPVVSLPLALNEAGLPLGLQVVGRHWSDGRLLAIALLLSRLACSTPRPPGY